MRMVFADELSVGKRSTHPGGGRSEDDSPDRGNLRLLGVRAGRRSPRPGSAQYIYLLTHCRKRFLATARVRMFMDVLLFVAATLTHVSSGGVYPGAVSTSEAHGPLARLALDSMVGGGSLRYVGGHVPSLPIIRALPPVSVAAPVAHAPLAHPVAFARYIPQPVFVQKVVDVTKPKVASGKLQVRRPGIQKQFYDVEERTVIRPVGTAVLELDEPISKNLISPLTEVPSGHHTVARYQRPVAYPVGAYPFVTSYPFQVPVQSYPPFLIQQTQGITQGPQQPQFPLVQIPQQPQLPQQPVHPQQPQQPVRPQPPQIPQQPQFPQQPIPTEQPQVPSQPPQQFPQPIGPPENSDSNEFDFSDTVVVDNPEFGRSRDVEIPQQESLSQNADSNQEQRLSENTNQPEIQTETTSDQNILNEFQTRQLLRQFFSQNNILSNQKSQGILSTPAQSRSEEIQNLQRSDSSKTTETSKPEESSESITKSSLFPDSSTQSSFRSSEPIRQMQQTKFFSEGQIASTRSSTAEEAQINQQKLIELLTGKGEISELEVSRSGVRITSVGDAGVVRGRVLSVTPASPAEQAEERVSSRRVVVSRPVQTLEEVDVLQPYTQVEPVAIHQPVQLRAVTAAPLVYH